MGYLGLYVMPIVFRYSMFSLSCCLLASVGVMCVKRV